MRGPRRGAVAFLSGWLGRCAGGPMGFGGSGSRRIKGVTPSDTIPPKTSSPRSSQSAHRLQLIPWPWTVQTV